MLRGPACRLDSFKGSQTPEEMAADPAGNGVNAEGQQYRVLHAASRKLSVSLTPGFQLLTWQVMASMMDASSTDPCTYTGATYA
jgi:hypothetical protein